MSITYSMPDLYQELVRNELYASYDDLEKEVLKVYNKYVAFFPPGYDYLKFIEWGERNYWICRMDGGRYRVADPAHEAQGVIVPG